MKKTIFIIIIFNIILAYRHEAAQAWNLVKQQILLFKKVSKKLSDPVKTVVGAFHKKDLN